MTEMVERLAHDESGSVIITVAFALPLMIAFAMFVLDVGNAFQHRRHLQLQADAGVLATGQEFTRCFTDPTGANAAIKEKAVEYAGGTHNPQSGDPDAQSRVLTVLNGSDYPGPSGTLGEPCEEGFIDVKLTEEDSPPIFDVLGLQDYHAHARLRILRLQSSDRLLPIAVEDPVPRWAEAIFVNEATGAVLARVELDPKAIEGDLAIWDSAATPISVPLPDDAEHVGVRIALSANPAGGTCGDGVTFCADATSPNGGLVHIRGWSSAGDVSGNQGRPIARSVELYNGTCTDPYFTSSAGCSFGVRAVVDFATGLTLGTDATVTATVGGQTAAMGYSNGTWSTGAVFTTAAGTGAVPVTLAWEQTTGTVAGETCSDRNNNPCKGSLGSLQRTFGAVPDRSGQVGLAQVLRAGSPSVNSFERCTGCSVDDITVKIGISGSLQLSDPDDPPVYLRVTDGSQTQLLDCDPDEPSKTEEIARGCKRMYATNTGTACPNSPQVLWSSPEPWECVAVQPSADSSNPVAQGLNCRILLDLPPDEKCGGKATTCTSPNNWPDVRSGDPRVVYVVVTPFGSFAGEGGNTVPVIRLAAFYVTGWQGRGADSNPCEGNGDEPVEVGNIVGRFIKYIETPNNGGASDDTCNLTSVDVCAAVLVE